MPHLLHTMCAHNTHVHMHVCIHTCVCTHSHACTHAYTHMHAPSGCSQSLQAFLPGSGRRGRGEPTSLPWSFFPAPEVFWSAKTTPTPASLCCSCVQFANLLIPSIHPSPPPSKGLWVESLNSSTAAKLQGTLPSFRALCAAPFPLPLWDPESSKQEASVFRMW